MTGSSRREALRSLVVGGAAVAALAPTAAAAAEPAAAEVIRLWPGKAPGAPARLPQEQITERSTSPDYRDRAVTGIGVPSISVYRPARPNGAAVLVIPGGGYIRVVIDKEGLETAARLNAAGVTAFVLRYRLPAEGWAQRADVPLQDAQRAMRLIRANTGRFGVDPKRIAVMGFSAGGHLAASLATRHAASVYAPIDAADRLPARPDLAALVYPVMSMRAPAVHAGSRDALLGPDPSEAQLDAYSPDRGVTADTPPTFLLHATDDASVPVENSMLMFAALRAAGRTVEMHIFQEGGHGFGLRLAQGKPAERWPDLFLAWAARHGFSR